ncbi:hypothetical protein MMC17_002378 [Xylographa soralifera]|nr:hypothetical protein [Xylographa soralifera]
MCSGPFMEATTGVIDLSDHHIVHLDYLLNFLYTGDYSDDLTEPASASISANTESPQGATPIAVANNSGHDSEVDEVGRSSSLRHATMYAIGDRYDIVPLKNLAKSKFSATVYEGGPCTDTFPELLEYVYTSTPDSDRGLRDPVQEICGVSAEYLLMNQDIIDIMLDVPTVAVDMCKGLLAWAETETEIKRDHFETLRFEHGAEKQELEQTIAENTVRIGEAEAKLEKYQALLELLRNCDACGLAFSLAAITDPLAFKGCFECQNAAEHLMPPSSGEMLARRRACEGCRRLKVQCKYDSLQSAACKRCSRAGRPCVITERRPRAKGNSKIAELERQLQEMSANLEAIKSQASQQDGQSEESPVRSVLTPESSFSARHARKVDAHDHDEEHAAEPHVQGAHTPMKSESSIETHALLQNHLPTSSTTKSISQGPLSSYSDVIDRGVITMDAAERALDHFIINLMPQLPIVVIQASSDAAQMRRDKPTLFLSILIAASGTLPILAQREINEELQRVFADRILVVGERSLELIQALQIAMVWYYPPVRYEQLKYYQLVYTQFLIKVSSITDVFNYKIHVTCVMAIDMGLNRRGKAMRVTGLIEARRGLSLQRKQYPDSSLIECRRAWLGCYFLAALTAQNSRRTNLIRWSTYLEECLQLLETSAIALSSDQTLCHWVRLQRVADEIGEQFNVEDPTVLHGLDDIRMKFMVQGFEAQLRECISRTLNVPKSTSIIFGETHTRLYLHEVALNSGNNNDDLRPPFTPDVFKSMRPLERAELSAGHIDSLSTALTSIHSLYQTFLSMPPATVRCLPTFQFVRLIYLSVVFIKLTADGDDFNVEHYLDDILMLLSLAAQDNQCASAKQFSMVLTVLKTLIVKHKPCSVGAAIATGHRKALESCQTGTILQNGTTTSQPIITHRASESLQETGMYRRPSISPDPARFGMETTISGVSKADGENGSTFGMTSGFPMRYNGPSEPPDFDMVDGDNFPSFVMDDDLVNSILANAPPDFFTQFDMEYFP